MEGARPIADELVLDFMQGHTLPRKAFVEGRDGQTRLAPELSATLVSAWCPRFAEAAAPIVEHVRDLLATDARLGRQPTPLTQSARSAGRDPYRKGVRRVRTAERVRARMLPRTCISCGAALGGTGRRTYCDACLPAMRADQRGAFAAAGPAALAKIRSQEGRYPAQRREVRERIGRSQSERLRADAAWDAEHPEGADRSFFDEAVPRLRALPLRVIAERTGLSLNAARSIRSGKPPHARHFESLARLAAERSVRAR